tara:strand:- start:281 stop:1990 length:1710 start_codon:yes stop_codon:yes gene_type:complete
MTADQQNSIQYGQNNHIEYAWSNIQQENILQLSFQMVRINDPEQRQILAHRFVSCFTNGSIDDRKTMIKLLAHTRDIECGKGEYAISFAIIKELMKHDCYRKLAMDVMCEFVGFDNRNDVPLQPSADTANKSYGSWKDMKYLFNELQECPIELVNVINAQITDDLDNMNKGKLCSLVAKWVPREKSKKFGWIHQYLAKSYFEQFGNSTNGWTKRAIDKAQTCYRKLLSSLNKYIDTVQIKQCGHMWKSIEFDKVTSITMMKQRLSFLNDRDESNSDRVICRQKMLQYIEEVKAGEKEIKGKNTSMSDFVKAALNIQHSENEEQERFIINETWKNNSSNTKSLENVIAMVDTSSSMDNDNSNPLFTAMGLGIRIAEKSKLGKRIMTFNSNPSWINMEECTDFVDEVKLVRDADWGKNTDFHKAMNLILDQIKTNKIPAEDVEDLVLVVFSDMQFDAEEIIRGPIKSVETIIPIISQKFHDVGIEVCGKGYKMPHILFWNLQSTNGFPELSYQNNVTMLSGYSPALFNSFIQNRTSSTSSTSGLKDISPWRMLTDMLNNRRYNHLEYLISE